MRSGTGWPRPGSRMCGVADRTSAALFADFFCLLAKSPTDEHKAIAKKLWPKRLEYDFSDYQMECGEALIALGLAKRVECKEYGGMRTVYANHDASGWREDDE